MKSFVWELKWWQGFLQLSFNLEIKAQLFSVTHGHSLTFAFASFSILFSHNHPLFQSFHSGQTICLFPCKVAVSCLRRNAPFSPSTLSSLNLNHTLDLSKKPSLIFSLDLARHPSSAPQQNIAYLSIPSLTIAFITIVCVCLSYQTRSSMRTETVSSLFPYLLHKQMIVE